MLTVHDIVNQVYEKWSVAVKEKVGDNYFMENSVTVSKFPAATCYFMGLPGVSWDLEGGEAGVTPSIQIDVFTNGQKALTKAYEIDEVSHKALTAMHFRRSYGPELIQATDPSIKRLTSRYTRIFGYGDSL